MTELLAVVVVGLVAIAGATVLAPRLGIASPIALVAIGVVASFLPVFALVHIEPEWILAGVLPPLLYSSAVSMPAMNFRREFGAISGLSVLLVVGSALLLGVFFMLVIPGLGLAWGVALGAIVSPTDAVAVSIIKKTSVSQRVVAMLDGESLLNDATALVLLRTAIVATAASFSFWGAVGTFAYAVVVAVIIGLIVGFVNLAVRKRVTDPTVNTVISFTVPFLAAVPAELLEASGLVAAVVAGLVTGIRAPRDLSPRNRLSDSQNWRTIELVLEGAVFLTMGLQIKSIVENVERDHAGAGAAVLIAAAALVLTIALRAAYIAPLLGILAHRARRAALREPRLQHMQEKLSTTEGRQAAVERMAARGRTVPALPGLGKTGKGETGKGQPGKGQPGTGPSATRSGRAVSDRSWERFGRRLTQMLADIDYFRREPLGWREGTAVVWAGMRGAVTVAAAQTLPAETPQRAVIVLIAFSVAVLSLLVQGGTIGLLLRLIAPPVDRAAVEARDDAELTEIMQLLRAKSDEVPARVAPEGASRREQFEAAKQHRLEVIAAQRSALLDARDNGTFDADVLASELANLDAAQIAIELRGAQH